MSYPLPLREVAHLDMDTFFVSVERLERPELIGKPVIVGGFSDRGVVSACSYETRKFGVHSAMPMKRALLLCPEAIVVRGDMERYAHKSREVTDIIADCAPIFEKASIDEHYLDLTGMDRFHNTRKWVHELRITIMRETGLPVSLGLSPGKCISKIATGTAKPNGERYVRPGQVASFLNPLPVSKIPGVGDKTHEDLKQLGIRTIGELAAMSSEWITRALGKNGLSLWEKANGIDLSPVLPYAEQKSISRERTFKQDTADLAFVRQILNGMAEEIGFDLRNQGKLASTLSIKIRYANFDTHTKDVSIPYSASDHVLIDRAKKLLDRVFDQKQLIRLIGLKVSGLIQGHQQLALFEDTEQLAQLYAHIDFLKKKYGSHIIHRLSSVPTMAQSEEKSPIRELSYTTAKQLSERLRLHDSDTALNGVEKAPSRQVLGHRTSKYPC